MATYAKNVDRLFQVAQDETLIYWNGRGGDGRF